ncbi:phenylalanyl-tRNA synthetase subunit alpha [bacterium 336/3]|nr:phenylalanyl-tRNA synthetase subunit alpha [bacterium 336/3]
MAKHEHYEILNLLGYGLSKFDDNFIKEFGFKTKTSFYEYCVSIGIAETVGTIKNRMDLFDPFFDNDRKGWWQKGDAYIHRKLLIDSLFGNEDVKGFANIVKLYLQDNYGIKDLFVKVKPITKTRFRSMQETGLEAELYFMHNFNQIEQFKGGIIEDARMYGDGYDFQLDVINRTFLVDIKGIRAKKGKFRMTEKEFIKAQEFQNDYVVTVVLNLNDAPTFVTVENPAQNLKFRKEDRPAKNIIEYQLIDDIC